MTLALPTDAELVRCAAAAYDPAAIPHFEDADNAIRVFLTTRADGLNIIAIEGTHDVVGWALDFIAINVEDQQGINHATLGLVHAGFYAAAVSALTRSALIAARGPYAICGHSLGAALALLIGALLADDMLPPVKVGAFAPPRVGGEIFVKAATARPFCAYRFGDDPVTEVPIWFPPRFAYKQVPLTQIGPQPLLKYPLLGDIRGLVRGFHHFPNYVSGVPD